MGQKRKAKSVPFSEYVKAVTQDQPRLGHIWWARCSVKEATLSGRRSNTASTYPMSGAMTSDLTGLVYADPQSKGFRPCILRSFNSHTKRFSVIPLATFGGRAIADMDEHAKHYSVSVGETKPWPSPDSHVLKPTPCWPLSRRKPCYAISHPIELPRSALERRYIWPVGLELDTSGETTTPAVVDGETVIALFVVEKCEMAIFEDVMENRKVKLMKKTREELQAMNASHERRERRRLRRLTRKHYSCRSLGTPW
ncbi:hypothetical protein AURDEDRAFT_126295 [Auricularia subglabra TFB-10046 SS5]|nr:hypothetical protein AURDEDRAFT_126295 [Auricularia subglabra TFB-10046 SS5]